MSSGPLRKFDLILLSDLVFNHSQHGALLDTCLSCLSDTRGDQVEPGQPTTERQVADLSRSSFTTPAVLCFFSHHRPTTALIEADLGILRLAEERGWNVERVWLDEQAGVSASVMSFRRVGQILILPPSSQRSLKMVATWRSEVQCMALPSRASSNQSDLTGSDSLSEMREQKRSPERQSSSSARLDEALLTRSHPSAISKECSTLATQNCIQLVWKLF